MPPPPKKRKLTTDKVEVVDVDASETTVAKAESKVAPPSDHSSCITTTDCAPRTAVRTRVVEESKTSPPVGPNRNSNTRWWVTSSLSPLPDTLIVTSGRPFRQARLPMSHFLTFTSYFSPVWRLPHNSSAILCTEREPVPVTR